LNDRPRLSVLVATIRGWPDTRLPIDAIRDQVARVGGEIVVVDGSGRPAPGPEVVGPDVRWISRPGESVFQLRSAGYDPCRGEIVAVTEDHCRPAAAWIAIEKGRAGTVMAAFPWIIALEHWHEAGEVVGYVAGPGRSPYGLR
jgi:hypothetical protein